MAVSRPVLFGTQDGSGAGVNVVAVVILLAALGIGAAAAWGTGSPIPFIVMAIAGLIAMQAPKVAQQWERAIILRLGRFQAMRGPGLFWVMPFVDTIASRIDQR